MPRRLQLRVIFPVLCLLAFGPRPVRAAEPSLSISIERNRIYLGESFLASLRVQGVDEGVGEARFDTGGAPARFEFLGSSGDSRVYVQNINGRTTRQASLARVLTYRVTPQRGGVFRFRSVAVPVAGRTVTAQGPSVQVVGVEPQDALRVEVDASREAVLVEEPFQITLSVTVRKLPDPNGTFDPFSGNVPPKLDIPYLAQPVPEGLQGPEAKDVLQPLLAGARDTFGFAINDLTVRNDPFANPFSMDFDSFGRPSVARFKLERDEVSWDGAPAWRYRLAVRYVPEREGTHTFGPVLFKGQVVTGVGPGGAPALKEVFAVGPAVTVRVVPPPEAGRPSSFVGCVGTNLTAAARLDAQTCKQGDPLRLTVEIGGAVSLAGLRPPQLAAMDGFAERFRVYDDAVRTEALPDGRRFTYTIRPLRAGTLEVPPIPVSYYDTTAREYRTVHTDPLPLRVEEVAQFDAGDIVGGGAAEAGRVGPISLQTDRSVPAGITMVPEGAVADPPWLTARRLAGLLPGPVLAGLAALLRWVLRHRRQWRQSRRRRRAARRAIRRVRRARSCVGMVRAVAGFFGDRFDLATRGFAPIDAEGVLRDHRADPEASASLVALLQRLFDQSFRPGPSDAELLEQARRELPGLLRQCSHPFLPPSP